MGLSAFPDAQIDALIPLLAEIKDRHHVTRGNIVGHSDIAPTRKQDPGELFPWGRLARHRLALPRPTRNLDDPYRTDGGFLLALERFGYDVDAPRWRRPSPSSAASGPSWSTARSTANAARSCWPCCCRGRGGR